MNIAFKLKDVGIKINEDSFDIGELEFKIENMNLTEYKDIIKEMPGILEKMKDILDV